MKLRGMDSPDRDVHETLKSETETRPRRSLQKSLESFSSSRDYILTVPSAMQRRPFGMDSQLQLLPPVHWHISNGHSKLNCTIVRLTVTDS